MGSPRRWRDQLRTALCAWHSCQPYSGYRAVFVDSRCVMPSWKLGVSSSETVLGRVGKFPTHVILSGVSFRLLRKEPQSKNLWLFFRCQRERKGEKSEVLRLRSCLKADRNCAQNDADGIYQHALVEREAFVIMVVSNCGTELALFDR